MLFYFCFFLPVGEETDWDVVNGDRRRPVGPIWPRLMPDEETLDFRVGRIEEKP